MVVLEEACENERLFYTIFPNDLSISMKNKKYETFFTSYTHILSFNNLSKEYRLK
jgi:hypothetical protein